MELLPGIILSFRETLEACLILIILWHLLSKTDQRHLRHALWWGTAAGVILSLLVALLLNSFQHLTTNIALSKIWESAASFGAVLLVTPFIIWMIRHGGDMHHHIRNSTTGSRLTSLGLFLTTTLLIAREGVEIVLFSVAGSYSLIAIILGIAAALLLAGCVYFSLFRIRLDIILGISLAYIILQAGYLLGYGIHELIASVPFLSQQSFLTVKVFDLSGTFLNHKDGLLGLPLHILLGWYSKPEWISFTAQYGLSLGLLFYWKHCSSPKRSGKLH